MTTHLSDNSVNYVLGFMFDPELRSVLLIKKNKPDWQKDKLNGIGGRIELEETKLEAMVREFKEGCDIETVEDDWLKFAEMTGNGFSVTVFAAIGHIFTYTQTTEEVPECRHLDWIALEPQLYIDNIAWLTQLGLDAIRNKAIDFATITYR